VGYVLNLNHHFISLSVEGISAAFLVDADEVDLHKQRLLLRTGRLADRFELIDNFCYLIH